LAENVRSAVLGYDWKGSGLEEYFAGSGQTGVAPVIYKDDWALVRRIHDGGGYRYHLR
jgi:phosphonate transport system substrate-binding protein